MDDNTLLDVALREYGTRRRTAIALVLSLVLNLALAGWVWSWVIAPGVRP